MKGRGREDGHHRKTLVDERPEIPTIAMDYCFMGKRDESVQPILAARDRDTRLTLSFMVREKGAADPYVVKRVLAFIREAGYEGRRIIIKSDQESPTRAVVDKIILEGEESDLRAAGVKIVEKDGSTREIKARKEIIISGGAYVGV